MLFRSQCQLCEHPATQTREVLYPGWQIVATIGLCERHRECGKILDVLAEVDA